MTTVRFRRPNPVWLGLGVAGWIGLVFLASTMWSASPRSAGFDLELLLQAGRDVAAGRSPYDPTMVAGSVPGATDLFYSYPPPVAQAMSLFAGLPSAVMFTLLWLFAIAGLAGSVVLVAQRFAPGRPVAAAVVPALAIAPILLPFSLALLFGNLDALFPFLYALVLVAAVAPDGPAGTGTRIAGGIAIAVATVAKVQPGALGGWFVGRLIRERSGPGMRSAMVVIVVAAVTAVAILVLSLALGGGALWTDYVPVAGAASGARLLDVRNVGPAAQLALLLGGDEGLVRTLHLPIAIGAAAATVAAGALVRDRLTGVAIAGIASLIILPVTWYHYPAALIPFAVAAVLRAAGRPGARVVAWLVIASAVVAMLSIALPALLWLAVALGLAAVVRSRERTVPDAPTTSRT